MASLAVWQPAVLGRKWTLSASRSTRLSSSAARLIRRIDAVTISVPLAATAASMILRFGYPAVPRNSRERNVRPAITSSSDRSCIDNLTQPPCNTRTISTRSPGFSGVAGHAARSTTIPLTETAIPRPCVCSVFSATSAATVSARNGSSVPFTLMLDRMGCVLIRKTLLLSGAREREAIDAERRKRRINHAVDHGARNQVSGNGRQQDAIAVMPGCINQTLHRPAAEDRRIIATARPMADPHLIDG